jgi:hypothetical protein
MVNRAHEIGRVNDWGIFAAVIFYENNGIRIVIRAGAIRGFGRAFAGVIGFVSLFILASCHCQREQAKDNEKIIKASRMEQLHSNLLLKWILKTDDP